jgi:peptide deformylase
MIKIVKDSNPKIREKSVEVPLPLSKEDAEFIEEMMKYLKLSQDPEYREKHPACREGVGLAAPQAGRNVRMLVISYANPTEEDPNRVTEYELVNPRIIVADGEERAFEEGCLSFPGLTCHISRPAHVVVEALNLDGVLMRYEARSNLMSVCLQHEIDHLHGITMMDHLPAAERMQALREVTEALAAGARPGDTHRPE